jgi:hypothetical protein
MNPQTTYMTVERRVVVTIMTLATARQLSEIKRAQTSHSVSIREMETCSKANTNQNDNHHKQPEISVVLNFKNQLTSGI